MKRIVLTASLLAVIVYSIWSYMSGGAVNLMLSPSMSGAERLSGIKTYVEGWGAAAPLGYMLIVTIEVVLAPIPGAVLYMPGGVIFGWFVGGTMSLVGNVLGAGIAFLLMRSLGRSYFDHYLEGATVKKYQGILEQRGIWIVFLLRVNPLTSSDIISYAAGLTHLPLWKLLAGTTLGLTPLCFVQAYFAEELLTSFPLLVYPLILIGIAYLVYIIYFLKRLARKDRA